MLIRLLCAHEMTKHVSKISHLNSKRLLRKLQKNIKGLLYFAAPCIYIYDIVIKKI